MPSLPSKKRIIAAQVNLIPEHIMGCDHDEAHLRCWCCGNKRNTERAHMKPQSLGGTNDPDNFLLLCEECHKEAPDVDKETMLAWLTREASSYHGSRWREKAMRDICMRYDIEITDEDLVEADWGDQKRNDFFKAHVEGKVTTHFGAGLSHASRVWMMEELLRNTEGVRLVPKK